MKFDISKPGTINEIKYKRSTFIRKAAIPKVIIVIGRAINWIIGFMKVLTTPITIAATTAAWILVRTKPGIRYATTKRAATFITSLSKSFILL